MTVQLNNAQMKMAKRLMSVNYAQNQPWNVTQALQRSRNYKHNHNVDFGYPETEELNFEMFYDMWRRNGFARALVEKTTNKTWQTIPVLSATNGEVPNETPEEKEVRRHLNKIRFWQALTQCDMRSMVGKWGGLILQLNDGKTYDQPVTGTIAGGIEGLISVIPCWEKQLEPSSWDMDQASPTYGQPTMYRFNENEVDSETGKVRTFQVHPDRCVIWSADGTTFGDSKLEPCFNALMDIQKIRGAGGEGYWKNTKAQPVLQADKEVDFNQLANMLGTDVEGIADALDEVISRWTKGFDQSLVLQGMEAKTIGIDIQEPKSFFDACMQEIAASWPMPQKVLVGMQTGERASAEDSREWSQIIMSRRETFVIPNIMEVINRLASWGILRDIEWFLRWRDLTSPTLDDRLAIGERMARINGLVAPTGQTAFANEEIRELAGYAPEAYEQSREIKEDVPDVTQGEQEDGVQVAPRQEDIADVST